MFTPVLYLKGNSADFKHQSLVTGLRKQYCICKACYNIRLGFYIKLVDHLPKRLISDDSGCCIFTFSLLASCLHQKHISFAFCMRVRQPTHFYFNACQLKHYTSTNVTQSLLLRFKSIFLVLCV